MDPTNLSINLSKLNKKNKIKASPPIEYQEYVGKWTKFNIWIWIHTLISSWYWATGRSETQTANPPKNKTKALELLISESLSQITLFCPCNQISWKQRRKKKLNPSSHFKTLQTKFWLNSHKPILTELNFWSFSKKIMLRHKHYNFSPSPNFLTIQRLRT